MTAWVGLGLVHLRIVALVASTTGEPWNRQEWAAMEAENFKKRDINKVIVIEW